MDHNAPPPAHGAAPVPPEQPAPPQAPAPPIQPAPPAPGAAQPNPAPPPTRNRNPRGPLPPPITGSANPGTPALLEVGAANPFSTVYHRSANHFVPSAIHLFHALGICDMSMMSTHRFLQSAPLWLPIVSQYYIATLWIFTILRNRVETGYASQPEIEFVDQLVRFLHIENCLVPGPLVPFFSALSATSSAFDWLGDVMPGLPNVIEMMTDQGHINQHWLRSIPFPAAIADQLIYWTLFVPTGTNTRYGSFEWYRNVFGNTAANNAHYHRLGPQNVAPLYTTESQHNTAHARWLPVIGTATAPLLHRQTLVNVAVFDNYFQFCGFQFGNGTTTTDLFTHVALTMQSYCMYFSGSIPVKAISPTGLAAVIPRGIPQSTRPIRDWIYPQWLPATRRSDELRAINPIPNQFAASFEHADHDLEEIAEQYSVTSHVNLDLGNASNGTQHGYPAIGNLYSGTIWQMIIFRKTANLSVHEAYGLTIASRYHHSTAIRPT